jgi:hypothetical protein
MYVISNESDHLGIKICKNNMEFYVKNGGSGLGFGPAALKADPAK